MLQGSFIGGLIGFVFLHPISMLIVAHTMPDSMPGMPMHQGAMEILMEALMPHHLWMSLYFTLMGLSFGFFVGILYARISEQRNLLQKQNEIIQSSLRETESLLRILSHDLNNCIMAGMGFTDLWLMNEKHIDQQKEYAKEIMVSFERASDLINTARKLSALESGKIKLHLHRFDLIKLIQSAISHFQAQSKAKNLTLDFQTEEEQAFVMVDEAIFVHTIIGNLLGNAIKFSPPDRNIYLKLLSSKSEIGVSITNVGKVIPPEKQPLLFSFNEKTTTPDSSGKLGTGFGLPLVSKFVAAMKGTIKLQSTPSESDATIGETTFIITLPRQ